jgi:hypothetical protein
VIRVSDGGILDIQGSITTTTIQAGGVAAGIDRTLCGPASSGRFYTLDLEEMPPGAADRDLVGRRLVFQSGKAVARQYEIVGADVARRSLTVCVDLDDAARGLGQRLTPHAPLARTALPIARHSQPAAGPSSACLAGTNNPEAYGCCTGAGTGFCVEALPAGGDQVAIVRDAWIQETFGTQGVAIAGLLAGLSALALFSLLFMLLLRIRMSVALPLALALASSLRDRPIASGTVAIGEVGLLGELRPVVGLERRLREAARLGFGRAIVPRPARGAAIPPIPGMEVVAVGSLREAIEAALSVPAGGSRGVAAASARC